MTNFIRTTFLSEQEYVNELVSQNFIDDIVLLFGLDIESKSPKGESIDTINNRITMFEFFFAYFSRMFLEEFF